DPAQLVADHDEVLLRDVADEVTRAAVAVLEHVELRRVFRDVRALRLDLRDELRGARRDLHFERIEGGEELVLLRSRLQKERADALRVLLRVASRLPRRRELYFAIEQIAELQA